MISYQKIQKENNMEEENIIVDSINEAKSAVRLIQEKLYEDPIDTKALFRITLNLNEYLDSLGNKIHQGKK